MAITWQGPAALTSDYQRTKQDGGIQYRVTRRGQDVGYDVSMPGEHNFHATVESMVGGKRHGISFLVRVPEIEGAALARAPLVEARYLHYSASGQLVLSPGFPEQTPSNWETAIGRVLSPEFEKKCLNCHGAARTPTAETGVRCESCHGAGSEHLKAIAANAADKAIVNPRRMSNESRMQLCAQCHAGFSKIQDPLPDDLLISSQVAALEKSQCYIQSGAGLSCMSCHNPHHDASRDDPKPAQACLGCHAAGVQNRAALCPVNQTGDCIRCHMPEVQKGSFRMADHWIRVHPEQGVKAARQDPASRTTVRPKRLYLRWVVAADQASAEAAHEKLDAGAPFFTVAQQYSTDRTAIAGGFLGDMAAADLEPALVEAAVRLDRGRYSPVIDVRGKPVIVYRMPRDFLYDAGHLEAEASKLRERGALGEAAKKYLASLEIYPYFLRSLIFLGVCSGQTGEGARALGVLSLAVQLYPNDPGVNYNLGIAYGSAGRKEEEIRSYRRAIELEPDLIPAYLNLGGTLFSAGRLEEAADVYRRALQQNPLAASLYYNLAQVYEQQGKSAEAQRASAVAMKINPKVGEAAEGR